MELALFIYLIDTICPNPESGWIEVFVLTLFLSSMALFIRWIKLEESDNSDNKALGIAFKAAPLKTIIFTCLICLVARNFIPTQKTAYTMLGAYGIQTFATTVYTNEQAKRIATNSLNLVETAISKYTEEMKDASPKR